MSTNVRAMRCSPEDVFAVLEDGWLFPGWVVGASRMRDVDAEWPHAGSRLYHSFGVWPALINDETVVTEYDSPRRLAMQPHGWPLGEALVTIDVKPTTTGCLVRIRESAVRGPGALVPSRILDIPLYLRNVETLRRLAFMAEGRSENGEKTAQR
jgi:hypothetical protein